MKSIAKLLILSLLFTASAGIISAQRYVNQEWSSITGLPLNIHWSSSMIASTGHIITVGNTYTSGQSTNVLLTKYATDGTIIWQVEYDNPDNLEDYGIAVCEDNSGNFYVAGTSFRTSSSSLELTVLKFNSSGVNQWAYFFDGSASGDDIPAEIVTDGTNVYVTGGTESTSTASDFVTIKVKNDGSVLWTKYYDHNSLDDVAVEVDINQSGDIIVSGGSADQANLYDMATVKYDASGNVLNVHRSNYNVGIDQPTCFDIDASGNSVIGGYYVPAPGEMKISIISLDDTLGLNWSILHDPTAGEDKITGLVTDASGNIYITGHVEESPDYFKCYTAKFDNSGNLVWERDYQSPSGGAFGKAITLAANGEVNVAGMNYDVGNDTNIITLIYKPDGTLITSKEYDAGGTEIASNLEADYWGNIYIHGTSSTNGNGYVTVKYSTFDRSFNPISDTSGFSFVDDEVLIQFPPSSVLPAPFDDKGKTFGQLSEFIKSNVLDSLNAAFEGQYLFDRMSAVKAFPRMTSEDSISISRLGDTIKMHHFWTTLVVMLPSSLNELDAAATINGITDVIFHSELNLIGELHDVPDDTDFGNQIGFESNNNPENDIEMDRAWDVYHGTNTVKVGIYDTGIEWSHEDFSETGSGTFNDSKIEGGWDFWNNASISSLASDVNGHGTACAGIVGAIRNNDLGVAGIAGGDESNTNFGAQLFGFKIFSDGGAFGNQTAVDKAADALVEGAAFNPNTGFGYGLHVLSNSWGIKEGVPLYSSSNRSLFYQTNLSVYNNEAILVCSRGNEDANNQSIPVTVGEDHFLISVGASDENNGTRKNPNSGETGWGSSFGSNLDIIAPGELNIVWTTDNEDDQYTDFNGTSAAAPHVAGVSALLMSNAQDPAHWNLPNQLGPDDIENLIQLYSTDVGTAGYDTENGFGRLNAGEVMEHMQWPNFWVQHFSGSTTSYTATQIGTSNQQLILSESMNGVAAGTYFGDVFEIEFTVNHNIGNAALLNSWIRNTQAVSNMLSDIPDISNTPHAELVSATATQATIRGHIFRLNTNLLGQIVNQWVPFQNGGTAEYGYSLHLFDENATTVEEQSSQAIHTGLKIYPNPTHGQHTISLPKSNNAKLALLDLKGRKIKDVFSGDSQDGQLIIVDLSELSQGVYFYRFTSSDQDNLHYKIVKQ